MLAFTFVDTLAAVLESDWPAALERIRQQMAPEPGDPGAHPRTCHNCGGSFWTWARDYRRYCGPCAADRMRIAIAVSVVRPGVGFEETARRSIAYWERRLREAGLEP